MSDEAPVGAKRPWAGEEMNLSRSYARILTGACLLSVFAVLFVMFGCSEGFALSYFEDDLGYYLRIADHIVSGAGSTFDGTTPTNGYQPLWMALLLLGAFVFGAKSQAMLVFVALLSSFCVSAAALLGYRLLRRWGYASDRAFLGASAFFMAAFYTGFRGMEVALTLVLLPLSALFAQAHRERPSAVRWGALCGVLTALVLSRIDSAIFAVLLAGVVLFDVRKVGGLADGAKYVGIGLFAALPLWAYLIWNYVQFRTWLPISMVAKTMMPGVGFELSALNGARPLNIALVLCCALGLLVSRPSERRGVCLAVLSFPLIHFSILWSSTDWELLVWYFYPAAFGLLLSVVILFERVASMLRPPQPRRVVALATLLVVCLPLAWALRRHQWGKLPSQQVAESLGVFSDEHPGTYAMGDYAGLVSLYSKAPFVQLEGLVMDRSFLDELRAGGDLGEVLRRHHVDYYITVRPHVVGDCVRVREPSAAGARSPHVRGEFCARPARVFEVRHHRGLGTWQALVYDLKTSAPL